MHDGLAQTLSYLGHQVDGLTEVAASERVRSGATPESPGAPACEYADTIVAASSRMRGIIDDATAEVRRFIAGLHVQPRPPRALQAVLEDALAAAEPDGPVSARFETDLTLPLYVSEAVSEQITRIVREALRNAGGHGGATQVIVRLQATETHGSITIADDGRGFDPETPVSDGRGHFGLSIMRARAARIGGRLDVNSTPGRGTVVALEWPVGPARSQE